MTTRRDFLMRAAAGTVTATCPQAVFAAASMVVSPKRKAGIVQTVLGPINASKMGLTLPHEHIIASSDGFLRAWPEFFGGRAKLVERVTASLKAVKAAGADTIVDVTPIDVGRDIGLLRDVSRASGVQIIACTGHWHSPSLSMQARTADELATFDLLEITRGIDGTGIKPGVIKVSTDHEGVTPFLENSLRAAARASKASGIPVTTHSVAVDRGGDKQAAIFEAEGLSPTMVCIGHSDETTDMEYLTGLAKRGYTLGMDHLFYGTAEMREGNPTAPSWQQRAETIKKLIDTGFVDRIFLSTDWMFGLSIAGTGTMEILDKRVPDGMLFNFRKTIPYLRQIGVSERQIRTITVDNPRRFFGGFNSGGTAAR